MSLPAKLVYRGADPLILGVRGLTLLSSEFQPLTDFLRLQIGAKVNLKTAAESAPD